MKKAEAKAARVREAWRAMSSKPVARPRSDAAGGKGPVLVASGDRKESRSTDARELLKGRLALPVPEVAELLGISSAAVRLMIHRGDLPGKKVGGGCERVTYIIPTGALLSWLDGAAPPQSSEDAA